ncbi:MAG: hypothetical protein M0Z44_05775 [Gammaproteobacteria bacterium]|nr:hypothetical protein [Gammaproteobacteria bacterium]
MKHSVWLAGLALVAQGAAAASWTLGNLPAYYSGRYGTAHTIGIFYDPTYIQYRDSLWRVKLAVPYMSVSGLPRGSSLSGGTIAARTQSTQTTNASGVGDIWLVAHYTAVRERGLWPAVVPYGKIKFGTASASEGLGTGRNDYEAGLGLDTTIGTNVFPFAHVGYRVVGSPAGQALQNIVTFNGGVSVATSPRNVITALYAGAQSEQPGYPGPSGLIVAWSINVTTAGSGFQFYVDRGFSAGSARIGGGVGGQVVF